MASPKPTVVRVPVDLDPGPLRAILETFSHAILEGGRPFGSAGRWSYYALRTLGRLSCDPSGRVGWTGPPVGVIPNDPLAALEIVSRHFGLADPNDLPDDDPDAPPFQGGLIGFLGYDLGRRLERLPNYARVDSDFGDLAFGLYDTIAVRDETTGQTELIGADFSGEGAPAIRRRLDSSRAILDGVPQEIPSSRLRRPIESNFTREGYVKAVRRALEYIRDGDIFQVNLSQKFSAFGDFEALDLFRRLRRRGPSPFSALIRLDQERSAISASPEWFYRTTGDRIVTRPIKGTRPRGDSPESDARLVSELLASPKDRAELTMIVDLERNDLGRVCVYGSVKVTDPMSVETYAQVHHLVATIEGKLRPGMGPVDVIRALFPGGSITGAPKIRAMEIIDELEPTRRGVYTGAIGYYGLGGVSAFNIAIRTMMLDGPLATFQVGGGIVADSDPEAEYEETLHKGRALLEVLEGLDR